MNTVPFMNLSAQYQAYQAEIDTAVLDTLASTMFIGGNQVKLLEDELAAFCGARHAITCSSGTDALLLALLAIGVSAGDEIIIPSFTFVATAEVVALLGCVPVFADVKRDDALIDPEHVSSLITDRSRAIIPVSLFGQCADMDALNALGEAHGLAVIEDAAQSFGGSYKGKQSCTMGSLACTSFFPAKPLGCYGDGGAVFTDDAGVAEVLCQLRNHGQSATYQYSSIGINGRLDALQAAILRIKLRHFPQELLSRSANAARYDAAFSTANIQPLKVWPDRVSSYAQYTLTCGDRDGLKEHLLCAGIPSAIYYPKPLHQQDVYKKIAAPVSSLPVTEELAGQVLSLPFCAFLQPEHQQQVIDVIHGFGS